MSANNVIAQTLGGSKEILDGVDTVSDARQKLGLASDYSATVNGTTGSDSTTLRDGDYVAFSRKVKGGK